MRCGCCTADVHRYCCRRLVEKDGEDSNGDEGAGGGGGSAKRADIGAVYQEMASVLVPRVIKRNAKGEQFRRVVPSCPSLCSFGVVVAMTIPSRYTI